MELKDAIYETTKAVKEYSESIERLIKLAIEHIEYGEPVAAENALKAALKMMED